MIEKQYKVSNKNKKTIALISDIHYSKKYNHDIFLNIFNSLKQKKPDYICIAGDIIDDSKILNDEIGKNRLYEFIKKLSKIAKVIIVSGNHDMQELKKNKAYYKSNEKYFNKFNDIENVYYLNNKNKVIDNINFIGWQEDFDYYYKKHELDVDSLCDSFDKKIKHLISDKYNILLFHSPINFNKSKMKTRINNIDLILCGHMHNGLVLKFLDMGKSNIGFIGPYYNLFPKMARGIKKINSTNIVISGGVIKLSCNNKLNKFNFLFDSQIEYIEI